MNNPNQSAIYHDKRNEVTNNISPDYSPDQQKLERESVSRHAERI